MVLLRPAKVAEILDTSTKTLERLRANGSGPEFVRVGRRVLYPEDAVEAWLASKRSSNAAQSARP